MIKSKSIVREHQNVIDILISPVITEKTYSLIDKHNTYVFVVKKNATKNSIKYAFYKAFEKKPIKVNTCNKLGKIVTRYGRPIGKRNDIKHAYITLPPNEVLDIFNSEK